MKKQTILSCLLGVQLWALALIGASAAESYLKLTVTGADGKARTESYDLGKTTARAFVTSKKTGFTWSGSDHRKCGIFLPGVKAGTFALPEKTMRHPKVSLTSRMVHTKTRMPSSSVVVRQGKLVIDQVGPDVMSGHFEGFVANQPLKYSRRTALKVRGEFRVKFDAASLRH